MWPPAVATAPDGPAPGCYLSCAPRDVELRDELCAALTPWTRERGVRIWHRDLLDPGAPTDRIEEELERAGLVVLMLSASHSAGEDTAAEMDLALARHLRGEARVIPVLVRPFLWRSTPVRDMHVLPSGARPVTSWPDRDEAWLDVVTGIASTLEALEERGAPPPGAGAPRAETIAERLASDAGARAPGAGPPPLSRQTAFGWEAWVFDRCAKGDHASLALLAARLHDVELSDRLREMAGHLRAGRWPPGLAPTLLRVERTSAGWNADVRIGFLGQVCEVALRQGVREPLGAGASLESDEEGGEVVVRLVARAGSALRGTRARVRAGVRTFTRWLVPSGTGALGANDSGEDILFEMALPDGDEHEEEQS